MGKNQNVLVYFFDCGVNLVDLIDCIVDAKIIGSRYAAHVAALCSSHMQNDQVNSSRSAIDGVLFIKSITDGKHIFFTGNAEHFHFPRNSQTDFFQSFTKTTAVITGQREIHNAGASDAFQLIVQLS